jgi:integrase
VTSQLTRSGHSRIAIPQRSRSTLQRTGAVLAPLYDRAGWADDAQALPCVIRPDRGSGQDAIPDTSHMLRHGCGYALTNAGHDTRALQAWLGHKNIQHTVRYTELAPDRFKNFWR